MTIPLLHKQLLQSTTNYWCVSKLLCLSGLFTDYWHTMHIKSNGTFMLKSIPIARTRRTRFENENNLFATSINKVNLCTLYT